MKLIAIIKTSTTPYYNNLFATELNGKKFRKESDVFSFLEFNFGKKIGENEIKFFSFENFMYFCNTNVSFDMRDAYISYVSIKEKKIYNEINLT